MTKQEIVKRFKAEWIEYKNFCELMAHYPKDSYTKLIVRLKNENTNTR